MRDPVHRDDSTGQRFKGRTLDDLEHLCPCAARQPRGCHVRIWHIMRTLADYRGRDCLWRLGA